MKHEKNNNLKIYYTIFKNMLNNLKIKKLILKIKYTKLFLKKLPMQVREKVMRKTSINSKKLEIIKFNIMCVFITKEIQKIKR